MDTIRSRARTFIASAFLRLYPHRDIQGVRVIFADLEADREVVYENIASAFALLESVDRHRYQKVLRYVREIVVWAGDYSAANPPDSVHICSTHVLESTTLEFASVLVHEAVHLRIARFGIRYENERKERIERRCIAEQAAFLRKRGSDGTAMAEAFEVALETPWWTDDAHRLDIERMVADGRLPRWMASMIRRSIIGQSRS